MPVTLSRRQFLKTGLAGSLLLATAFALHKPLDRLGKRTLVEAVPFDGALRLVMPALAPVILLGAMPVDKAQRLVAIQRATDSVAIAVSALSASAQRELAELFALLAFAPTRMTVAGVGSPWPEATEEEISRFLERWRNSSLDLLKSGYLALHDLTFGAWYADPLTWAGIGYPGPPKVSRI